MKNLVLSNSKNSEVISAIVKKPFDQLTPKEKAARVCLDCDETTITCFDENGYKTYDIEDYLKNYKDTMTFSEGDVYREVSESEFANIISKLVDTHYKGSLTNKESIIKVAVDALFDPSNRESMENLKQHFSSLVDSYAEEALAI